MASNASAVYAIYPDNVALPEVLQALGRSGFDKESICMLFSPSHPIATSVRESVSQSFDREASSMTSGLIGWLAEFGAVVIPQYGFFIRSREFFQAFVTERDCVERFAGNSALVSLGFARKDAERFESHVRKDGVLLYMSCPETAQTRPALELLRTAGAEEAGMLENESALSASAS
jgi:hypothetical protein